MAVISFVTTWRPMSHNMHYIAQFKNIGICSFTKKQIQFLMRKLYFKTGHIATEPPLMFPVMVRFISMLP